MSALQENCHFKKKKFEIRGFYNRTIDCAYDRREAFQLFSYGWNVLSNKRPKYIT